MTQAHPHAESAAEAAEFAATHGRFWEMHDGLYENQGALGPTLYLELAERLGLQQTDLRAALDGHLFRSKIKADFNGGVRAGVNGTPAFYINGKRHEAGFEYDELVTAIDAQLATSSSR